MYIRIFAKFTFIITLIALGVGLWSCEQIKMPIVSETHLGGTAPLTVMTYNVYMGSSVALVLSVENLLQVPTEVANVYKHFIAFDFPGRAQSTSATPYRLIGDVADSPSVPWGPNHGGLIPAEEVVMDFRVVLLDALRAEGLDYRIAVEVENTDVEVSGHIKRIDLIFVCNSASDVSVLMTQTFGDTPSDRLALGLWASNHACVVA